MKLMSIATLAALLFVSPALADFNLQITELFPGVSGDGLDDVTEDWFEITNYGDMPYVQANDGLLFYDDNSEDPVAADEIFGISEIQPGQSVIVLIADNDGAITDFQTAYSNAPGLIVGRADGSGLGGGGDGATLFSGASNFPDAGILPGTEVKLDFASYPDYDQAVLDGVLDGSTYDVVNGRFSIEGVFGAFASAGGDPFKITGSPGSAIPEPASLALVLLSGVAMLRRRR